MSEIINMVVNLVVFGFVYAIYSKLKNVEEGVVIIDKQFYRHEERLRDQLKDVNSRIADCAREVKKITPEGIKLKEFEEEAKVRMLHALGFESEEERKQMIYAVPKDKHELLEVWRNNDKTKAGLELLMKY